jgi:hypothetical protein
MLAMALYGAGVADAGRAVWNGWIRRGRIAGETGEEDLTKLAYGLCAVLEFLKTCISMADAHVLMHLTYGKASRASASSRSCSSMNLPKKKNINICIMTSPSPECSDNGMKASCAKHTLLRCGNRLTAERNSGFGMVRLVGCLLLR